MTTNQQNLIKYIHNYWQEHGRSPTYREMVTGIGVSDVKSVFGIVEALIDKGFLTKNPSINRSIALTTKAAQDLNLPLLNEMRYDTTKPIANPSYYYVQPKPTVQNSVTNARITGVLQHVAENEQHTSTNYSATKNIFTSAVSEALGMLADGTSTKKTPKVDYGPILNNVMWMVAVSAGAWVFDQICFSAIYSFGFALITAWFIDKFLGGKGNESRY